jgi:hypothetical protein
MADADVKMCACGCGKAFVGHPNKKYATKKCAQRAKMRRYRSKQTGKPVADPPEAGSPVLKAKLRRGPQYDQFVEEGWPEALESNVSRQEVAEHFGVTEGTVSRWLAAYAVDKAQEEAAEQIKTHEHLDDLGMFTRRYFPELEVPDFHLEWEREIDETVGTGGKLLLLASQRHGKSEMLIRYCIRRIAEDPNISIGWVGKTQDLAEKMVGYIRQVLEHHPDIIADITGGKGFRPDQRSGLPWTNGEFTVTTRTKLRKSPTMVALGVGGTILGRDFDLIILDDPQDRARCMSPSQREKDKEWLFTDFLSRKEPHTGVAFIMSRQHVEDLPGNIIRDQDDWRVLVYRAHDPGCTKDEEDEHLDCVLWPTLRPYEWLMEQKRANEAHFERNYQNNPRTDSTTLISKKDIDRCKDHSRTVGMIPKTVTKLVAGIDPADAKPVAAVLWGFEPASQEYPKGRRHVIDIYEAEAGIRGAREIIRNWIDAYHVPLFVVEKNMAQSWWQDTELKEIVASRAQIKPVYTSRINKWSDATGIVAMFSKMRGENPEITIPWGDRDTQQKMDRLVRTCLLYDPDYTNHKHADDDLPMAAWFPQTTMDQWVHPMVVNVELNYPQTGYVEYGTAYPGHSPRRIVAMPLSVQSIDPHSS